MINLFRGEVGLNANGKFCSDPWYLIKDHQVIENGFGKPPKSFFSKKLESGVIIPGLVNSHSHIELSYTKSYISKASGVHHMAEILRNSKPPSFEQRLEEARKAVLSAQKKGTFFFIDIANDPFFSKKIKQISNFNGIRCFELLGFSPIRSNENIKKSIYALENDCELHLCPHSIYGSSPLIMDFVVKKIRNSMLTMHFLESPGEKELFLGSGVAKDFLSKIGQWHNYIDLSESDPFNYLKDKNLFSCDKIVLAHLNQANSNDIDRIANIAPHASFVICERSNYRLGYLRKNLVSLVKSPLTFLIGTDSLATSQSLSILDEMLSIQFRDELPEFEIWKAGTFNAYNYFNIAQDTIPYYFFPGAKPTLDSMIACEEACQLHTDWDRPGEMD